MVKHKREAFLSDAGHRALVISGVIFGCAAVDALRVCFKIPREEAVGFFVPALLFTALSVFLLLRGLFKALKRKRTAAGSRRNFIENGVLSHGKVTAAGGGYYRQGHYREHHARRGKSKNFHIWESRWWADIDYYDERKGVYKRHRVIDLNKNGARLIGRDAALYHLDGAVYVDFQ